MVALDTAESAQASSKTAGSVRPEVVDQLRLHSNGMFVTFFVGALFDEVAMPEVAASVDRTGRFERNFADRGMRSAASSVPMFLGRHHSEEGAAWLKKMHSEVRGSGKGEFADIRYSALEPDLWNWIMMSALMLMAKSFPPLFGFTPTAAEMQAWYADMLTRLGPLRLEGKNSRLSDEWAEVEKYYDRLAATRLAPNAFLDFAVRSLTRLPLPTLPPLVRAVLTPSWFVIRPVFGHVVKICSFGIMHQGALKATRFEWKPRHTAEFRVYTTLLRAANRVVPVWAKTEPVFYLDYLREKSDDPRAKARYEWLRGRLEKIYLSFHESLRLDSFVPDDLRAAGSDEDVRARARAAGCPF